MSRVIRYGGAGFVLLTLVIGALWSFLTAPARMGLLAAAGVAFPVQIVAFGLMVRYRDRMSGFLTVWVGGTLMRMGIVLVGGFFLARLDGLEPIATLVGLAGFFFVLLLLEPLFLGAPRRDSIGAT